MSPRLNRTGARAISIFILIVVSLPVAPGLMAQGENRNSDAPPLPFDALIAGGDTAQIPWEVVAEDRGLTPDQRLRATVEIRILAPQLSARLGKGTLTCVTQLTDSQGHTYRNQEFDDLVTLKLPPRAEYLSVIFNAFVLPGEYEAAVVIYDSATKEYNVAHRELRVAAIKSDPLAESWSGLPSVEFWPARAPLESIQTKLKIPLETKRPVRVELLFNTTLTKGVAPSKVLYERSLATLIPEFETLSKLTPTNGKLDAAALDLTQQKVIFEQDDVNAFDWERLNGSLTAVDPGAISVAALQGQGREAQYFAGEVMRRIPAEGAERSGGGTKPLRALIILSGPMSFPSGQSLRQISLAGDCNCRVYYIRSHALEPPSAEMPPDVSMPADNRRGSNAPGPLDSDGASGARPPSEACPENNCNFDELENTLAPLHPRVFDVYSPMDFRKALGSILSDMRHF